MSRELPATVSAEGPRLCFHIHFWFHFAFARSFEANGPANLGFLSRCVGRMLLGRCSGRRLPPGSKSVGVCGLGFAGLRAL